MLQSVSTAIEVRSLHPSTEWMSKSFIVAGSDSAVSDEQPLNALSAIFSNESGRFTLSIVVQSSKTDSFISFMPLGNFMVCSPEQPLNAPSPMVFTLSGIVTLLTLEQFLNASFDIPITL